jgi:hypothetical protein
MVTHGHSAVCDYGRQTRTIPDSLYELLVVRDGGCRWPGCDVDAAFCDAHHALHWGDLGETEPDNSPCCAGTTTTACTSSTSVSSPSGPATSNCTHQTAPR